MRLSQKFLVVIKVESDRPPETVPEADRMVLEKELTGALSANLLKTKVKDGVYPAFIAQVSILSDTPAVPRMEDGGGFSRLTEETREGQKRVRARNELEALCVLVDEKLGTTATVSAGRNPVVVAGTVEEGPCVWVVRVEAEPVYLEARHPDLLVALGMAASALKTEGV